MSKRLPTIEAKKFGNSLCLRFVLQNETKATQFAIQHYPGRKWRVLPGRALNSRWLILGNVEFSVSWFDKTKE